MAPFIEGICQSQPDQQFVGVLHEWNGNEQPARSVYIPAGETVVIGRSPKSCQIVVNDFRVSKKHLRIYAIVFDQDNPTEVAPLAYAQDTSLNGTLWNGRRMDRKTGGVLLSNGDTLRICDNIAFTFQSLCNDQFPLSSLQLNEIKRFKDEYLITNRRLGSGAYGHVHMALNLRNGTQVACKIVDLSAIKSRLQGSDSRALYQQHQAARCSGNNPESGSQEGQEFRTGQQTARKVEEKLRVYEREVEILQTLRHPNIIGIEMACNTGRTLYIFEDLIPAGDLFSFLEYRQGNLPDVEAAVIVRQIAMALDYLHDKNIVHRDLKPDNILMTSLVGGSRVVLTDFGCARHLPQEPARMASIMGTFEYTAPEIDRSTIRISKGYTKSVDLWSLGCVTAVLLTGGSPFQHSSSQAYSRKLAQECNLESLERSDEWIKVGKRAKSFVRRLLVLDENLRMTAKESLQHEWFTNPSHKLAFNKIYQKEISDWKPRSDVLAGLKEPDIKSPMAHETLSSHVLRGLNQPRVHSKKTPGPKASLVKALGTQSGWEAQEPTPDTGAVRIRDLKCDATAKGDEFGNLEIERPTIVPNNRNKAQCTARTAASPMRHPFSPAAWSKARCSKPKQAQELRKNQAGHQSTNNNSASKGNTHLRRLSKQAMLAGHARKRRAVDIFAFEEDDIIGDCQAPVSGQRKW
ncbi:hypothetical protein LOZ61_001770 [Ophidiomyces ophidiicola]|nr:hypothetical protein LOZ61_001770 [Ophidiomyces ophidiicola]KAI1925454.1 hypothetical protein LOZ60_004109 [Ophidiomyces ophidiicola]KAI2010411.1 hypothetical protein LOZ49_003527 [Ophidiomyces ophidiicola]KAI2018069.1 hypothetical protein LOZ46_004099 [Ophidiomyces ophidiicola]KAI2134287.1 hypothetical protein LOZ28_004991 [Ophidiomyces ophidiicola]